MRRGVAEEGEQVKVRNRLPYLDAIGHTVSYCDPSTTLLGVKLIAFANTILCLYVLEYVQAEYIELTTGGLVKLNNIFSLRLWNGNGGGQD